MQTALLYCFWPVIANPLSMLAVPVYPKQTPVITNSLSTLGVTLPVAIVVDDEFAVPFSTSKLDDVAAPLNAATQTLG